jgi:hypothetical protein
MDRPRIFGVPARVWGARLGLAALVCGGVALRGCAGHGTNAGPPDGATADLAHASGHDLAGADLVSAPDLTPVCLAVDRAAGVSAADLQACCQNSCGAIFDNDLRAYCQGNCGGILDGDLRAFCQGSCGAIVDDDLRYFCQGSCGAIVNDDFRYYCQGNCGAIADNNLRSFCQGVCGAIN